MVHQKYREDAQWMRKDEGYHGDQELVAEAHRIAGDEGWSVAEVLDSGERSRDLESAREREKGGE